MEKLLNKIHYCISDLNMTIFEGRIATEYKNLPLCNPDFIYLDGPSTFIKKRYKGFSFNNISEV